MSYNISYAYLSDLVYTVTKDDISDNVHYIDPAGNAWILKGFESKSDTGYQGAVFVNADTHQIVLANRGTEISSSLDFINDVTMGIGKLPSQYGSAVSFYNGQVTTIANNLNVPLSDITIVGHSLGGSLSQLLGALYGNPTDTFNAYGAGNLLAQLGISNTGNFSNINNTVLHYDPVSVLPGSQMLGQTHDYQLPQDSFFSSPIGQLLALQINPGLFTSHILESHGIGNFLSNALAAQLGNLLSIDIPNPLVTLADLFGVMAGKLGDAFSLTYDQIAAAHLLDRAKATYAQALVVISPITLDLNGGGVQTTALNTSQTHFDYAGEGFAERTGWVAPGDGLLVRDKNNDGQITTGDELFGSNTVLANGQKAANGFIALAELDGNHDNKVDANDNAFNTLQIWQDTNGDARVDSGELHSLASLGIQSISTAYTSSAAVDANGNNHAQHGSFTRTDGSTAAADDVWYVTDPTYSVATTSVAIPADIAALPDLPGYGFVRSLHEAMALDASGILKDLVIQFTAANDFTQRQSLLQSILYQWSDAMDYATDSRGQNLGNSARLLYVVEAFLGQPFTQGNGADGGAPNYPGTAAAALILQSYQEILDAFYSRFVVQTRLQPYLDDIALKITDTGLTLDYDAMRAQLDTLKNTDPVSAATDIADLQRIMSAQLPGWDGLGILTDWLGDPDSGATVRTALLNAGLAHSGNWAGGPSALAVGSSNADQLISGNGDDVLMGLQGADTLIGKAGNDLIDGGTGNDILQGDAGSDTYRFAAGSGQDIIAQYSDTAADVDTLYIAGQTPGNVTLNRSVSNNTYGNNLIVSINGTVDTVLLANYFSGSQYKIAKIQFDDGTVWDASVLDAVQILPPSTAIFYGITGSDVIDLRNAANTTAYGYTNGNYDSGNDTYLFGIGAGQDTINDYGSALGNVDTLKVIGILPSEVTLSRAISGASITNDLVFSLAGTTDTVTVQNYFAGSQYRIEKVQFDDGTVWNASDLESATGNVAALATGSTLFGTNGVDVVDLRNAANTSVYGPNGGSNLGNDTYLFGVGAGQDVISDYDTTAGNVDTLKIIGKPASGVSLSRSLSGGVITNDLVFSLTGTTSTVTVQNYFAGSQYRIEKVQFDDGAIWNADDLAGFAANAAATPTGSTAYGTNEADVVDLRNAVNTTVYGPSGGSNLGNDVYLFGAGAGQDIISDYDTTAGNTDVLKIIGQTPANVTLTRSTSSNSFGNDLILSINGTTDKATVQNYFTGNQYKIEKIQFDDGTVWDSSMLDAAQILPPSSATFYGTSGNDVIDLRNATNTTVYGPSGGSNLGNDVYLFGAGAGQDVISDYDTTVNNTDTLRIIGKAPSDVTLTRSITGATFGYDLIVALTGSADKVTVQSYFSNNAYKIERIQFDDGTVWTSAQLDAAAFLPTVASFSATAGADTIDLRNSANTTAYGYTASTNDSGNDVYIFAAGSGQDTIKDYGTAAGNLDTLKIIGKLPSEITLSRGVGLGSNDLLLSLTGTTDRLTVQNHFLAGGAYKIEKITFDDGTVWDAFQIDNLNVDHAPVVAHAIASQSVNEDSVFTFAVPANTFTDSDSGDVLSYRATLADGSALPAWLHFDAVAHTFSGTPTNGDVGNLHLQVIATDRAGQMVSSAFDLVVANTNDAPTLNQPILPLSVTENSHFSYTLASNSFTDVDSGDHLNYSATLVDGSALPSWLTFDAATQTFSGAPAHGDLGNLSVNLHASDSAGLSAEAIFNVTIVSEPAVSLTGSDANETLIGTAYADTLNGGNGSDTLAAGAGDDTLIVSTDKAWQPGFVAFNAGSPGHVGTGEIALITGKTGSFDYFDGGDGVDTLRGTTGNDALFLDDIFSPLPGAMRGRIANVEIIDGGEGDDVIDLTSNRFAYGDVTVVGGAGDDVMWTSLGNDILEGGLGNDHLAGGAGNDIYTFSRGDGHDTINDYDVMAGNDDLLRLIGLDLQEMWMQRLDDALEIFALADQGSQESRVTVEGWYQEGGAHRIETLQIGEQTLSSQQVDQVVQAMEQVTLPPAASHWSAEAIEMIAPVLPVVL